MRRVATRWAAHSFSREEPWLNVPNRAKLAEGPKRLATGTAVPAAFSHRPSVDDDYAARWDRRASMRPAVADRSAARLWHGCGSRGVQCRARALRGKTVARRSAVCCVCDAPYYTRRAGRLSPSLSLCWQPHVPRLRSAEHDRRCCRSTHGGRESGLMPPHYSVSTASV
ncbi:hypothetical protein MRX96_030739 [Rhipicephalus microplus]